MELSDNEKRDAVKFIEAGKPLPDKYRFLLFGEKGEVEFDQDDTERGKIVRRM